MPLCQAYSDTIEFDRGEVPSASKLKLTDFSLSNLLSE